MLGIVACAVPAGLLILSARGAGGRRGARTSQENTRSAAGPTGHRPANSPRGRARKRASRW
jgi:hypothetical protein